MKAIAAAIVAESPHSCEASGFVALPRPSLAPQPKPYARWCGDVIQDNIPEMFDNNGAAVVVGCPEESEELVAGRVAQSTCTVGALDSAFGWFHADTDAKQSCRFF